MYCSLVARRIYRHLEIFVASVFLLWTGRYGLSYLRHQKARCYDVRYIVNVRSISVLVCVVSRFECVHTHNRNPAPHPPRGGGDTPRERKKNLEIQWRASFPHRLACLGRSCVLVSCRLPDAHSTLDPIAASMMRSGRSLPSPCLTRRPRTRIRLRAPISRHSSTSSSHPTKGSTLRPTAPALLRATHPTRGCIPNGASLRLHAPT